MGIIRNLKNKFFGTTGDGDAEVGSDDVGQDAQYYEFSLISGDEELNNWYKAKTELPATRLSRRMIYDDMDQDFIKTILNMYANDATQFNLKANATVWVESKNTEVSRICTELFNRLDMEDNAFAIVRSVIKYGEEFDLLTYSPSKITAWEPVPGLTYAIHNEENILSGYSLKSEEDPDYSLPWDFVPFILKGEDRSRNYGTSMLDALLKVNSKLMMMEDAAAVYRVLQIPDRDVYYIDCTGCSIIQAQRRIKQVRDTVNKQRFVDASKTQMGKNFKLPGTATGSLFVPLFQDRQDRFEKQSSQSRVQDVYDLEYFSRRLASTAGIPPELLGMEVQGQGYEANKSLVLQDVRYARMIKRPQRAWLRGLVVLCEIELCLHNIDPTKKENSFKVAGDPISFLEELQRQDLYEARLGVIESFTRISRDLGLESEEWAKYLLTTFGGFTPEMVDLMYGSAEEEPEQEPESVSLTDAVMKKLDEEYRNNKGLQKKVKEASEIMVHYMSDAITRSEDMSKYDSSSLYLPFLDKEEKGDLFKWKEDVVNIRKQINENGDKKFVKKLEKELSSYKTGSYRQIKESK